MKHLKYAILTVCLTLNVCSVLSQTHMPAMIQYKKGIEMYTESTIASSKISGDTVSVFFRTRGRKVSIVSVADSVEIYATRIVYKLKDGAVLRRYFEDGHLIYTNEYTGVNNIENLLIIMRPDSINSEP